MIFASKAFFLFLPIVLILYHVTTKRSHKYRILLLASWLFYAWVPPHYWPVILLLTVIDYVAGLQIEQATSEHIRRRWLTASVVSNLGLLFAFKYTSFVYDNAMSLAEMFGWSVSESTLKIALPLGISFHTFQGISYTVDVYRRQIRAVESFVDYALFVSFFPQLAAGPIVRAVEFLPQLVTVPPVTRQHVADGIWLFVGGLVKKLLIADHLDQLFVADVFHNPTAYDAVTQRWAVVAWAVQIYCDFSGYTDMALGCAKWFGLELPPNFRNPYLATSITDFWRRWHLSLSTWLRDYLYFPLGGSKGSALRTYVNLFAIFVLCGLWHGAAWNWLAYGVCNGILMCVHRLYDRALTGIPLLDAIRHSLIWKIIAWACTTYQFLFCLILVRMNDWSGGVVMMESMLGFSCTPTAPAPASWHEFGVPLVVPLLIVCGLFGHGIGLMQEAGVAISLRVPEPLRMIFAACGIAAVVVLAPGVAKTFIYIQF